MKKNLLSLIAILISVALFAQTPKLSPTQAGKPQLPTPKIPAIKPADLSVTTIQLISAEKNTSTKSVAVRVRVTLKNNGQVDAAATKLAGSFQKIGGTSWSEVSELVDFPAVKGGQSVTKECVYKILIGMINDNHAVSSFNFRVNADVMNVIKESDENNNFSQGILIGL